MEVGPIDKNQRPVSSTEATDVHVNLQFTDVVTPQTPTSGNSIVHEDVVPDSNSPMEKYLQQMLQTTICLILILR